MIDKGNAKINALMAKLLTDNKDAYSFTLLKKLLTSTNWTVRYNSAVSILAYQKYGQQFLQLIQQQTNDNTSRSMADLRLRINAVEKGTLC